MHLPEVPHIYDMYAQDNARMQHFRDVVSPWLDSKPGQRLLKQLEPLAELIIEEPEVDKIPKKYAHEFSLGHKFDDEQLAHGPRHIGHLIGAALREQALTISKGDYFVTPVLPDTFAVSRRVPENVVLLAKGANDHLNSLPPATEAKLAWRVQAPTSRNSRQAIFTLVGRRIIPQTDKIALTLAEFGRGTE